jgi:hypothetical protein
VVNSLDSLSKQSSTITAIWGFANAAILKAEGVIADASTVTIAIACANRICCDKGGKEADQ